MVFMKSCNHPFLFLHGSILNLLTILNILSIMKELKRQISTKLDWREISGYEYLGLVSLGIRMMREPGRNHIVVIEIAEEETKDGIYQSSTELDNEYGFKVDWECFNKIGEGIKK